MQNIINFQYFISTHQTLFVLLIIWSIAWKGFALWKAAKNNNPIWFIILLIVNTLGLLEIIYLFAIKNKKKETEIPIPAPTSEEIKIETKVEEKEKIAVPMLEIKPEEINHQEIKTEETKEGTKQEINQ